MLDYVDSQTALHPNVKRKETTTGFSILRKFLERNAADCHEKPVGPISPVKIIRS